MIDPMDTEPKHKKPRTSKKKKKVSILEPSEEEKAFLRKVNKDSEESGEDSEDSTSSHE